MSRRKPPGARSVSAQDRREQAEAARAKQLAKFHRVTNKRKEHAAQAERDRLARPKRDIDRYIQALEAAPFRQVGVSSRLHVSSPYKTTLKRVISSMNECEKSVLLCWPQCDPSPAAIASMLMLADCGSCESKKVQDHDALSAPRGLRALVFPYARTAHRALRHIYVDKDYLGPIQLKHHIRNFDRCDDQALADFHKTLSRAKSLTGIARDGKTYEELLHPCLDEILPSGPCVGSSNRSGLLWRVGKHTDIRELGRSGDADDPTQAHFYLFGLRANENAEQALSDLPGTIDVVLLDLDYTGRHRLGEHWVRRTKEFVATLKERFGELPIIALTDDPWAYDTLRFDALGAKSRKKNIPCASAVINFPRSDIVVGSDHGPPEYSEVSNWEIYGFSGAVEMLLIAIRSAMKKAYRINDRNTAEAFRDLSGRIRRSVSLPGSLSQLSEFYAKEQNSDLAAADLISEYRLEPIVRELRDSTAPFAQLHRAELLEICSEAEKISSNVTEITSMRLLLHDVVAQHLRKSSRTLIIAPDDIVADFAVHVLESDAEIGELFSGRRQKGMLIVADRSGLSDLDILPIAQRNEYKRAIVFAPSRRGLLSILSREWLPETMIILGDCDTLKSAARDTERLAEIAELGDLKSRMRGFSENAAQKVEEITRTSVTFDSTEAPGDDLSFPRGGTVNLAANARAGQSVVHLEFEDGQNLIARPKTKLVIQNRTRAIPSFTEVDAKDVGVGDYVCVIGDAFLDMARPILNISVRAAEEIRIYHSLVLDKFSELEADGENARLALLVKKMGLPDVSIQRAKYWIELEDQIDAPLPDVVPHAPRDWPTFKVFMAALGVGERTAIRYWTWAVIAQRASRHRAALSFHEAYRGILVEGYSAQSDNPQHAEEIRKLRAAAENFVSVVSKKSEGKVQSC